MWFDEALGKIRAPQGYFLDLASEEIACSTGVLLTDQNLHTLSHRYEIDELQGLERGERETVIRPEDFEDAVLNLRVAIGNLPDTNMAQFVFLDACMALSKKGADPFKISEAYLAVSDSGKYSSLTDEATEEIIKLSRAEPIHVYEFLIGVAESQRRQLNFLYGRVTRKAWDGTVALDKLFSGEHIPGDPTVYLDQRYIDFLAKNGEDFGRITGFAPHPLPNLAAVSLIREDDQMFEVVLRDELIELGARRVVRYRVGDQSDNAPLLGDRLKAKGPAIDHLFERSRVLVPPELIEEEMPEVERLQVLPCPLTINRH